MNGMDRWDSGKSLCHWKRDVPLSQWTVDGNAGHVCSPPLLPHFSDYFLAVKGTVLYVLRVLQ